MTQPTRTRRLSTWLAGEGSLGFKLGFLSLAIYFPGFRWGIPYAAHPITVRGWAIDSVAGINTLAELNNLFVHSASDWYTAYPVFHYLLLGLVYAPYLVLLKLSGNFSNPTSDFPFGFAHPETALGVLVGTGQLVSLLMAACTVGFAYHVARALGSRSAGVLGALGVMLAGPMVYYSRTGNLDVPVQFWTAAGLLVGVHTLKRGLTLRRGVALGLLAAVSVATKDQAYGIWIPALLYLVIRHLGAASAIREPGAGRWKPVLALIGSGAAGYAVFGGLIFWPGRFVQHLQYVRHFEQTFFNVLHPTGMTLLRPPTAAGYVALLGDLARGVSEAVGPVPLVLGVLGLVLLCRDSPGARFLALSLVGYIVLTVLPVRHMQYRYAVFPLFVLAIFAGIATSRVLMTPRLAARVAGFLLLVVALGTEGYRALDLTWQMVKDARYPASEWLTARARPGDRLGFFGALHQLPALPASVEPVQLREDPSEQVIRTAQLRFIYVAPDYFSDPAHERSTFLPEAIYARLLDGSLGFRLVERFETRPLRSTWLRYFPYINPPVQVFERLP